MKRIQRKRTKGWRMSPDATYVGRPSRWGNGWRIGDKWYDGEFLSYRRLASAADLVDAFRQDIGLLNREEERDYVGPLRGRDLACWCPLDEPCHADVLLELANAEEVTLP